MQTHPFARCCVLLGVIAQSLKPVKRSTTCKRVQQVPTLSGQQFWELLRPFARSLSNGDGDVNENGKTAIGFFFSKTTTLHGHQAFLYISLPLLHVLSRFMEDVNKRQRIFLSLFKIYMRTHLEIMRHWKSTLMLTRKRLETGDISRRHDWFPCEMYL